MAALECTGALRKCIKMEMIRIVFISFIPFLLVACQQQQNNYVITDTPSNGTIHISVDESFQPVIEQQIKVYESSYPDVHIIAKYEPEVDCFKDLIKDSTRMIIVARGLNKQEASFYLNKLGFKPLFGVMAFDAVAVIVNQNNPDSVFTLNDLRDILSGKKNIPVVMDGTNATSTVRYLQDTLLHRAPFGKNVMATGGSDSVVSVIKQMNNAIGFVGISWVGNPNEPKQVANLKKIRLGLIECTACGEKDVFVKPSQASITYGQYPLIRPIYYILKENAVALGTGFKNFMTLERGQLIFRSGGLAPAKMDLVNRKSQIKE